MEMQKKNEDLCSKMENDMPTGGLGNELGDLEAMNGNMLNNFDGGDNMIEPENQYGATA